MSREGAVVYLAYSGLVQHSGEHVCHLNRLRALGAAGLSCSVVVMELADNLASPGLPARMAEVRKANPSAVILTQQRSARRVRPEVLSELVRGPVSVILFTQSQAALAARDLKRRLRAPAIWDCRGFAHERMVVRRSIPRRAKDWFVANSERVAARVADHTVCVSEAMRDELVSRLHLRPETITVVPNGTNTTQFRPDPVTRAKTRSELGVEGKFLFVFSGAALAWHCLRETADFVAEAKQALPDVHLLMLCPDVAGARSALERSRLPKERATVISAAHAEVPRFLAAADAAFLMVAASPGKDVCSPMKFSEYLACGLPVVIGPVVGDYTRWVRDERVGVVADPARPEDWPRAISALVELLKDSVLPARCRQVACERLDTAKHPTLLRRAIAAAAKARP